MIEKDYTLSNGMNVHAIIAEQGEVSIRETDEERRNRPFVVGDTDIKTLEWNDFFDEKLINWVFRDYRNNDGELCFRLEHPEDFENSRIGMYVGLLEKETENVTGRYIFRDSIGTLMVSAFVITECTDVTDKRGREYEVILPKGIIRLYEHFRERIDTEATEKMKTYFAFMGGLLESTMKSRATSPDKMFMYLDRIVK